MNTTVCSGASNRPRTAVVDRVGVGLHAAVDHHEAVVGLDDVHVDERRLDDRDPGDHLDGLDVRAPHLLGGVARALTRLHEVEHVRSVPLSLASAIGPPSRSLPYGRADRHDRDGTPAP